jgi:hypothetical protein
MVSSEHALATAKDPKKSVTDISGTARTIRLRIPH